MRHFLTTLHDLFSAERERMVLWLPLPLMLGIWAFFNLPDEPPPAMGLALLGLAAALMLLMRRTRFLWLVAAFSLMALGFVAAQLRTGEVATPLLARALEFHLVEGTIEEISPVEQKVKIVFSDPVVEGEAPETLPRRIRVSFRHNDPAWQVGDRLRFMATLFPLPAPDMPGAYDFARHFYFRGIGATGFAMKQPEIIGHVEHSGLMQRFNNLRHSIGEDMRARMPGEAGTVAAAMTVGESGPIPENVKQALHDSGLAHMLAIAGLHLGIVAGIVFFTARLLLTLYPRLSLRFPVKKVAALLALAAAFIYLMLAGFPIPAQRAFIMVTFLFGAMMLDRRGISLRTLSIAALLILLAFPEAMFGASFQMSFAATLAIVSLFERYGGRLHPQGGFLQSLWRHVLGITATSLIATMATAPFVLYNFNRFAMFGLLANMVVIPLATFAIMPSMVVALLLMPFGLQGIAYVPLDYSVGFMIAMARWVTSLPWSALRFPSPTDWGLGLCALGLMWLCLWRTRWHLLGLPLMLIGLATIALYKPYDVMVSDDGSKVAMRLSGDEMVFVRGRPNSFDGQAWVRASGHEAGRKLADMDGGEDMPACDKDRCDVQLAGMHIVVGRRKSAQGLCSGAPDMVIFSEWLDRVPECQHVKWLIGKTYLRAHGAVAMRIKDGVPQIETVGEQRGKRVWNTP